MRLKNKAGVLSIEALMSVSIFLLVIVILINLLTLISTEERMDQYSYDLIKELEIYNYLYEKIGFDEITDLSSYKDAIYQYAKQIPNLPEEYLELLDFDEWCIDKGKEFFLSSTFKTRLESELLRYSRYTKLKIYEFDLEDNLLGVSFKYDVSLPLGFKFEIGHKIEKELWLFGDESDIYPNETLISKLKKEEVEEKSIVVYKTRTGGKFHTINCFYIVRSSTDKDNIVGITLKDAKSKYGLTSCSRCMKGK